MKGLRTLILALALMALAPSAWAKSGGGGGGEIYTKLPTLVVEFWDQRGVFHILSCELTAVFKEPATLNKKLADRMVLILSSMSWEDFSQGNTAATVKSVALDVLRADPGSAKVQDVLIAKMMIR